MTTTEHVTVDRVSTLVKISSLKDALATLRGAKRIHLHVRVDALLHDDPDSHYHSGWSAGVALAKPAARAMLEQFFEYHDENNAHDANKYFRMSVSIGPGPLVRNRRTQELTQGGPVKTVWIGA